MNQALKFQTICLNCLMGPLNSNKKFQNKNNSSLKSQVETFFPLLSLSKQGPRFSLSVFLKADGSVATVKTITFTVGLNAIDARKTNLQKIKKENPFTSFERSSRTSSSTSIRKRTSFTPSRRRQETGIASTAKTLIFDSERSATGARSLRIIFISKLFN